eukprot:TRINITY_DN25156_c0_g1_i1.p2 TRINITY_DN25156_c0_g1~~TRINITY_DN25156_c0_g1_i1.p2  ORF type:complete len:313 (+),score=91.02 TRINITY_DN25156_c0_g1_i1:79-939(+)
MRAAAAWACGGVAAAAAHSAQGRAAEGRRRRRVLVTGFLDWKDLSGLEYWRCRDNPSCRLLVGEACPAPPPYRSGPLAQKLRRRHPEIEWCFGVLPTVWGTSAALDLLAFDAVVHLGLGVYHTHSEILVEDGAYNGRASAGDAIDRQSGTCMDFGAGAVLMDAAQSQVVARLDGHHLGGGFVARRAVARPGNQYICNETHFRALRALKEARALRASGTAPCSAARLEAAYFVHIPYPAPPPEGRGQAGAYDAGGVDQTDWEPLSDATCEAVSLLLEGGWVEAATRA